MNVSAQLKNVKPGGATISVINMRLPRALVFYLDRVIVEGEKMLIKELQDLKREVLRLKEELERLKAELLTARIEELRQTAH